MAFADIELRDNGSSVFDISLSGAAPPAAPKRLLTLGVGCIVFALLLL